MCFVWISEQTAIIFLYNINWLVCITETESVYCAVRTVLCYLDSSPASYCSSPTWISLYRQCCCCCCCSCLPTTRLSDRLLWPTFAWFFSGCNVFVTCDACLWAEGKHFQHLFYISRVKFLCPTVIYWTKTRGPCLTGNWSSGERWAACRRDGCSVIRYYGCGCRFSDSDTAVVRKCVWWWIAAVVTRCGWEGKW